MSLLFQRAYGSDKIGICHFPAAGTLDGGMKKMVLVPWIRCEESLILPTSCAHLPNSLERDMHHISLFGPFINLSRLCVAPVTEWYIWLPVLLVYGP